MPLLSNLTTIILLLIAHCGCSTLANRLGPYKGCLSCKEPGRGPRDHIGQAGGTSMLAQGEPCGVYTMSCAKGLRCVPPPQEHSPLQALLQGRGFCTKHSRTSPTERPHPTGKTETQTTSTSNSIQFSFVLCVLGQLYYNLAYQVRLISKKHTLLSSV